MLEGTYLLPLPDGVETINNGPQITREQPEIDQFDGRDPHGLVPVPWWALVELADAYLVLNDPTSDLEKKETAFRQMFGLSGEGRGNRGIIARQLVETLRKKMAISVADLMVNRYSLTKEIDAVAQKFGRSSGVVWQAWKDHESEAQQSVHKRPLGS